MGPNEKRKDLSRTPDLGRPKEVALRRDNRIRYGQKGKTERAIQPREEPPSEIQHLYHPKESISPSKGKRNIGKYKDNIE